MNEPDITHRVTAFIQADHLRMSFDPLMRAQSRQRWAERPARAEKLAIEAQVKSLFPRIAFTFVVLGLPIVMQLIHVRR